MSLPAASVVDPKRIPAPRISEAVKESRDTARRRRGLERTNVRDSSPAAAPRKIHKRHVVERNVTKNFVRSKMQTPILGCGRTHRECRPPALHTRVTSQLSQMLTPEMFTLVLGKSLRFVQSEVPERFDFRVSHSRILFPYHAQPDELYRRTTVSCPNLFHE
jgi:hypothetical protein